MTIRLWISRNQKSVREWTTVIAATIAVAFTWTQISDEREARKAGDQKAALEERRSQAEQISAWIASDEEGGIGVEFSNTSVQPIYQAVVTPVTVYGAGPTAGREIPEGSRDRRLLAVLPPGHYQTSFSGSFHGMHTSPGIEIAFKDRAGRNWVRHASGDLREIRTSPIDYYRLAEPVEWELPKPVGA